MKRPWGDTPVNLVGPWDIFGQKSRIVPIFGPIASSYNSGIIATDTISLISEQVIGSLWQLAREGKEPVKVVINSPGGDMISGFLIGQAMKHLEARGIEVWTINLCMAASMAGIILMLGTKGRRFALKDTVVHTHSGTISPGEGRPEDVEPTQEFQKRVREKLIRLVTDNTKIPEFFAPEYYPNLTEEQRHEAEFDEKTRLYLVKKFLADNRYFEAEDAKRAGIIDEVLEPGNEIIDQIYADSVGRNLGNGG